MPRLNKRTVSAAIILAAIAALATAKLGFSAVEAPQYVTEQARLEDFEQTVMASGVLEPYTLVNVGAQVSGQLVKLNVKVGDQVEAGQVIGQIDSLPQQNTLRNAEASLENVRAQRLSRVASLKQAELAHGRQRSMLADDATSREAYENALAILETTRAEIASLDAQIRQASIAVDIAKLDLSYTRVTAPIDGVVVAVVTEEGRTVNANQSAPTIVMLARLDVMKVKAEISEADVTQVKAGQKVYFTVLGEPDKRYYATLQAVEPAPQSIASQSTGSSGQSGQSTASNNAVYYNGLFEMPNPDGELRASMTAQVYIVLGEAKQTLVVPSNALGKKQGEDRYQLRVLDQEGKAVERTVRVGMNNRVIAQVLEGLAAGEQVVVGDASAARSATSGGWWNR